MDGIIERGFEGLPEAVRSAMGQALYTAQMGETDPAAKPLRGFGGTSVMEIIDRHDTNTYRVVYIVQFTDVAYVLHAFQQEVEAWHCDAGKRARSHSSQA